MYELLLLLLVLSLSIRESILVFPELNKFNLKTYIMNKTIITLTRDEKLALNDYPTTIKLQYIWVGILAMRNITTPSTLDELDVKYLGDNQYEITSVDYSLAG